MPIGVYVRTEETKKKMRESLRGKFAGEKNPMYGKPGTNLGKHFSEEHRKKIGDANRNPSEETRKKMSKSFGGRHHSEEAKQKLHDALVGRHLSEETKRRMSIARSGEKNPQYGKRGELCPSWKGGISFEDYSLDWVETFKESIRQRDHHICRLCGNEWEPGIRAFPVHHIDYIKKHCAPNNLITLCHRCHIKTNSNREHWIECFRKLDSIFV